MGWTSCYQWEKPSDVRDEILADYARQSDRFEVIDHKITSYGRNWWMLLRCKKDDGTHEDIIVLYLIRPSYKGSGCAYKDIEESMGPCEVDCPLSLLDKASDTTSKDAVDWRERVRAAHAARKAGANAFKAGQKVKLYRRVYTLIKKVKRSWMASCDYSTYRITPKHFGNMEVQS